MPITIVSSQLNTYGGNGTFEPDRSTWVFGNPVDKTITRSSVEKVNGLYSALCQISTPLFDGVGIFCNVPFASSGAIGRKFLLRAKVRVPAANPFAAPDDLIKINVAISGYVSADPAFSIQKTITEATDTWVEIQEVITMTAYPPWVLYHVFEITVPGTQISGGKLYTDDFEVYECLTTEDGEPEPEPEPDETDEVNLSKNPITLGKAATSGWEGITNYRLYNDVRVEEVADSAVYVSKLKTELPPAADGNVVFYLNAAFEDAFTFVPPTLNHNTIIRLTDRIKRFKNFSGELDGLEVVPGILTESNANLVMYGGIDKFHYPGLNYLTSYLPTNKKFLTWAPVEKYVDRLQEDYLNFWVYDEDITSLKLQIKAYFDDDTNETAIATEFPGCVFRSLYQIPAGPANSGATLVNPAKNLVKYELTLLNQDDEAVSETRTFYITLVRHPLTRFFMFLNSLGSFEVLMFTGQATEETSYVREVVQKFLPHDYAALDGEFATNSNVMEQKNSYSSGFIKNRLAAEWHEYLKDFLLSPIVYEITSGKRIPITVSGGIHSKEDQNYQRFIRFEAKPAYDNQSFTPSNI